jgi:hypothetical protein
MNHFYSPNTGEHIVTDNPADWMGNTAIAPPAFDPATQGVFFKDGAWVVVTTASPLPVAAAIQKIDADTDAIYGAVLGNRAEEYTLAASEARSYKAAGYTGAIPSSVQSWATAKAWTATQAADDILATAAAWITAQAEIRAARLTRKEQARTALDAVGVAAAMLAWDGFVVVMRGRLGI